MYYNIMNINKNNKPKRTDILKQEFSENSLNETIKGIDKLNISIILNDIRNYRPLTVIQLIQLERLTYAEKIILIKTYNNMNYFNL